MLYKFQDQITNLQIHLYLTFPTPYIINNYQKLLPHWQKPPEQLIIFLLQSQLELIESTDLVQREKDRLKTKFFQLAIDFQQQFNEKLEIICPQTGKPINFNFAQDNFDIIAVIHQVLGIEFKTTNDHCKVLNYNDWKSAVYPCLIVAQNEIILDENKLNSFIKLINN